MNNLINCLQWHGIRICLIEKSVNLKGKIHFVVESFGFATNYDKNFNKNNF